MVLGTIMKDSDNDQDYAINDIIKNTWGLFKEHPTRLTTIFALILTIMSYIFSTKYLSSFSIDFFSFAGITDIYQIPLSKGISLPVVVISISIIGLVKTLVFDISMFEKSFHSVAPIITIFLIVGLGFFIFYFIPESQSNNIKKGFAERYIINTDKDNSSCLSIIGSTSEYLFTWNYANDYPVIISKSSIIKMDQVVPAFPKGYSPRRGKSITEVKESHLEWSKLLDKKCNQQVVLPEYR